MHTRRSFDLSPLLSAAAAHLGHPVSGDVRWVDCRPSDLTLLREGDRELVQVLTGERLEAEDAAGGICVSFLVAQLLADRRPAH